MLASGGWLALSIRWILTYRRRQVLDIDEAGYIGMALNDHYAALRDGLGGWLEAVFWPGIQAPVVPALTSLQFFVTGTSVVSAFTVPLLAGLAVVLLTYHIAHRLGGIRLAWLAMLLVATAPRLVLEARAYHFAAPAAAVTTAALYCLIRSERMSRTGFAVGFGVLLGLMPLTRTMTVAFVPALILAAILHAAIGPDRRERLIRCAAAMAMAVGVAATWLVPSADLVLRYLSEFGYGRSAEEFGNSGGLLSPTSWLDHLRKFIGEHYLPHAAVLLAGIGVAVYVTVRRARSDNIATLVRVSLTSPVMPIALLAAGGVAAFVSSPNLGTAFTLPLVPAMVVLALWGLQRTHAALARALPALITVVSLIAIVPLLDLRSPTARPWHADLPLLGGVTITDGRGSVQAYAGAGMSSSALEPISVDVAEQWIAVSDWGAQQIVDNDAVPGVTAFGFRDYLFNTNTVQLAVLRKQGYGVAMAEIKPTEVGNTGEDYLRWMTTDLRSLSGDASKACVLFTATGTINEFTPVVDPPGMARAAEIAGFTPVTSRPLPNGRVVTVWHRGRQEC